MNSSFPAVEQEVVVAEHFDPTNLTPGGIDSIIHDIVKFAQGRLSFRIVGVTSDPLYPTGIWKEVSFANTRIQYLAVAYVDRTSRRGLRGKLPHSFIFAAGLFRYMARLPNRTFHTHRIETGFIVSKLLRKPIVQFIHNDSNGLLGAGSDSVWRKLPFVYRALETTVLERARRVVLFNKSDSKRMLALRSDVVVSRTWFDSEIFDMDRTSPSGDDGTDSTSMKLCWIGRLDSQKDPLLALEVVKELILLGKDPQLTVVGDGVLRKPVEARIRELRLEGFVHLVGPKTRAEVAAIMGRNQALLMTSKYEGSPVVLLEAGASGLPVVATAESDPDGALQPNRTGERIENRDSSQLAIALIRAVAFSPDTCRAVAEERAAHVSVPSLLEAIC